MVFIEANKDVSEGTRIRKHKQPALLVTATPVGMLCRLKLAGEGHRVGEWLFGETPRRAVIQLSYQHEFI
jgi:hypothetical protein